MFGAPQLYVLAAVWAVVTVAFAVVTIAMSVIGRKEKDVIILDPAEDTQAAEQREVIARIQRLSGWAKGLGFSSLALLLVAGGIGVYQALGQLSAGPTP